MINLLPSDIKSGYRYGRLNTVLRRWVVAFFAVMVGLGAIGTYGLLSFHQSINNYNNQILAAQTQLAKDNLGQTKKQVQDVSNSLRLAVKVLSNEVLFSKLIQQIGAVMPQGTVLTGLNIIQVSGGIELSADSANYTAATQVQVNLQDPANQIFSKVDIESINCGGSGTSGGGSTSGG